MEYNFSITPRLLFVFIFCAILFVLSVFFAGAEAGKMYATSQLKADLLSKSKLGAKINEIKPELSELKMPTEKLVVKQPESNVKK